MTRLRKSRNTIVMRLRWEVNSMVQIEDGLRWEHLAELPQKWVRLKQDHYRAVFGERWEEMYDLSALGIDDWLLSLWADGEMMAKCYARTQHNVLKIHDFAVDPAARGSGLGRIMMAALENKAQES